MGAAVHPFLADIQLYDSSLPRHCENGVDEITME